MRFGLMFFAATEEDPSSAGDRYRLVIEAARFADRHGAGERPGLDAVWVPERHFTRFGSLYPNPAVLHAALARETSRVALRAGSVVLPLHDPIRVVEEWAMVDNLSGGRVGVSFAAGWNPADFAFFPERYPRRRQDLGHGIETVRRLWRGEPRAVLRGDGERDSVRVFPTPVQRELPIWVTAAGNPETYALAGELGAHLLTHLLDQGSEQLAEKIAVYRRARAAAGHDPATGTVSLMLHTFLGSDVAAVREEVREPYCRYLESNLGLLRGLAHSRGSAVDVGALSASDRRAFVELLFDRFAAARGLIGTPESSLPLVRTLAAAGVDEIACLLDFGPPADAVLAHLPDLLRLVELATDAAPPAERRSGAAPEVPREAPAADDLATVRRRCGERLTGADLYERFARHGVGMAGAFRGVAELWRRDGEALARLELDAEGPALLDVCLQATIAALPAAGEAAGLYLPSGARRVELPAAVPTTGELWSHAVLHELAPGEVGATTPFHADVTLRGADGRVLGRVLGLRLAPLAAEESGPRGGDAPRLADLDGSLVVTRWPSIAAAGGAEGATDLDGDWLLVGDRAGARGVAEALAERLQGAGARVATLAADATTEGWRQHLDAWLREAPSPRGVVHLGSLDATLGLDDDEETPDRRDDDLERDLDRSLTAGLHLLQALVAARERPEGGDPPRLWCVTRGAMPTADAPGEGPAPLALAQGPLWGLVRVARLEHPRLRPRLVDLDPAGTAAEAAAALLAELGADDDEGLVALRRRQDGTLRRLGARLERLAAPPPVAGPAPLAGTALVTGGLGGLGLQLAAWLVDRGCRHLLLVGRSAPDADAEARLDALRRVGATVRTRQLDVADRAALAALLEEIDAGPAPLAAVYHLAGIPDARLLRDLDAARLRAVGAAKIAGAWNLHRLTRHRRLDRFVLFSSAAAVVPLTHQGAYAAASTFLDLLAHHRRALGLPALAVGWGPWAGAGHATWDELRDAYRRFATLGVDSLEPQRALDLLARLLAGPVPPQVGVVQVDWRRLLAEEPLLAALPLLENLRDDASGEALDAATPLRMQLASAASAERVELLVAHLRREVAAVLRLEGATAVDPRRGFFDSGMDSLTALELRTRLQRSLGQALAPTLAFEHPTVEALARHLALAAPAPTPATSDAAPGDATDEDDATGAAAVRAMSEAELLAVIEGELEGELEAVSE